MLSRMAKKGWRVYAALLTLFVVVGELRNVLAGAPLDAVTLANWILTVALLVALWGYALQRPIGNAPYWRAVFWLVLAATALMLVPVALGPLEVVAFTMLLLALAVPAYVAAFRYAYRCPGLWSAGGGAARP